MPPGGKFRFFAFGCAIAVATGRAGEPPLAPIIGVEVGFHTAMIRRLAVDEAGHRALTAGDDKTVRVWSLPELKLQHILRPPLGPDQEGVINALAISPDGRTAAAGGWTGAGWDGAWCAYLFNVETGEIAGRIPDLPNVVGQLAFSKNGRFLAVGLGEKSGLKIYETLKYTLVGKDENYAGAVVGIDFDPQGRLATASLDRIVRLYDASFKLIAAQRFPEDAQPVWVRFSPDGAKIAVGTYTRRVEILSAKDLTGLYSADMTGLDEQKNLPGVAWSPDGRLLYAIGDQTGAGSSLIYCWPDGGKGPVTKLATKSRQRLTDLHSFRDGSLLYTAEDPLLGLLDPRGQPQATKTPEIPDFRDIGKNLRASNDGSLVQFSYERGDARIAHFSLLEEKNVLPGAVDDRVMPAPVTSTSALKITDWKNTFDPRLNGISLPPELGKNHPSRRGEYSRCVAVAPDESQFVLGGEWSLRVYDRRGSQRWVAPLAQIAWGVTWSGDGKSIVAALSDGTLRWYRAEDGGEYFALFPHRNGHDWIAWVPGGYYASSEYGDNYVGWQLNRGKSAAADFYQAVQFERLLYRYDIVIAQFASRGAPVETTRQFDIAQLAAIAPPKIKISHVTTPLASNPLQAVVGFSAEKRSLDMRDYTVFLNNLPVTPHRARHLAGPETAAFSREITLDLSQPYNRIRIEVSNGRSLGFIEEELQAPQVVKRPVPPGVLYVLAIGVNRFPTLPHEWELRFAANDADAMAECFRARGGGAFKQVKTRVLSDSTAEKPDSATIRDALAFIETAEANDTVIVFLSSHGITSPNQTYFFVPRDAAARDIDNVIAGQGDDPASLIRWDALFDALRGTAGKRLLIVDTCSGGNVGGTVDAKWLKKRSASALFALMVSCGANEKSQEFNAGRHGLFTYALLEGLRHGTGAADRGAVRLAALSTFAAPIIQEKRENKRLTQTPQLIAPPELADMILTGPIAR